MFGRLLRNTKTYSFCSFPTKKISVAIRSTCSKVTVMDVTGALSLSIYSLFYVCLIAFLNGKDIHDGMAHVQSDGEAPSAPNPLLRGLLAQSCRCGAQKSPIRVEPAATPNRATLQHRNVSERVAIRSEPKAFCEYKKGGPGSSFRTQKPPFIGA